MDYYVKQINENNQDGSFLRAVLAIRNEQYHDAMAYIEKVCSYSNKGLMIFDSSTTTRRSLLAITNCSNGMLFISLDFIHRNCTELYRAGS